MPKLSSVSAGLLSHNTGMRCSDMLSTQALLVLLAEGSLGLRRCDTARQVSACCCLMQSFRFKDPAPHNSPLHKRSYLLPQLISGVAIPDEKDDLAGGQATGCKYEKMSALRTPCKYVSQ